MSRLRILASLVLFWAVLSPVLSGSPEAAKWIRLETPSFVILSGAPLRTTQSIAQELESFRQVLSVALPSREKSPKPTWVYVFGSRRLFEKYASAPGEIAGFYMGTSNADYLSIDGTLDDSFRLVFHEYTHRMVHANFPGAPMWLNEGLAHFFETTEIERRSAAIGMPNVELRDWIVATRDQPPLAEVLTASSASQLYRDPAQSTGSRALSWALVHYLLVGERDAAGQFFALLNEGRSSDEALTQALGRTPEQVQHDLRTYVGGQMMTYLDMPLEASPLEGKFPTSSIDRAEALSRLVAAAGEEGRRRAFAEMRAAESIVMAVALAAEGRKTEAISLLEEVASGEASDEVRARARELLAEIGAGE